MVAASLRASDFAQLSGTNSDFSNTYYQALKEQFMHIGVFLKSEGIRWMYATRMSPKGIVFLLDSADPSDPGYSAPGVLYALPPLALQESFEKPSFFIAGPYTDEYGTYISAFAPVYLTDGTLIAMIAVDMDYQPIQNAIRTRRIYIVEIGVGLLVVTLVIYYFLFLILEAKRTTAIQQRDLDASKNRIQATINELEKERQVTEARNRELERMNTLMVNRELKMIELKKELDKLRKKDSV